MEKRKKYVINDEPIKISLNKTFDGVIILMGNNEIDKQLFKDIEDKPLSKIPSSFVMIVSNKEESDHVQKRLSEIYNEKDTEKFEKLARDFEIHFGFSFETVFGAGSTKYHHDTVGKIIPFIELNHKSLDRHETLVTCKCYAKNQWKKLTVGNVLPHEDKKSSWNCFLAIAGNPEYGIILKEYNT